MVLDRIRECQKTILDRTKRIFGETSVSRNIREAFLATPRHCFVPRYLNGDSGVWSDVDPDSLGAHIDDLYADQPLCIYQNQSGKTVSTISQPSLVLEMLHLLDLEPGQKVFELGGGSGWNAALAGRLVKPDGKVFSMEIEDALVSNARKAIEDLGITNVEMISGDAAMGFSEEAPFDRCLFTASSKSLPLVFFDQVKQGGILLFVFKFREHEDLLLALRKTGNHFQSELHFPCSFVPLQGSQANPLEPLDDVKCDDLSFARKILQTDAEDLIISFYKRGEEPELGPRSCVVYRKDTACVCELP